MEVTRGRRNRDVGIDGEGLGRGCPFFMRRGIIALSLQCSLPRGSLNFAPEACFLRFVEAISRDNQLPLFRNTNQNPNASAMQASKTLISHNPFTI